MSHYAHPQPLTPQDWFVLAVLLSPIAALWIWGVIRLRRARRAIHDAVEREGLRLIAMRGRWVRQGPFFWTTTRSQMVYRLTAEDEANQRRTGWARWGRTWLFRPDRLELKWDE
jgi:hypothetical protein